MGLVDFRKRTEEEQRTIAIEGGKASGIARRKKSELRKQLRYLLNEIGNNGKPICEEICLALIAKALTGDVRAFEAIRDTIGEKPVEKVRARVQGKGLRVILLGEREPLKSTPS